jgi:heat shock protein HslJ
MTAARRSATTLRLGFGLALLLALPASALGQSDPSSEPVASQAPAVATTSPLAREAGRLPLEGTTWRLRNYRRGGLQSAGSEVAAWLSLRDGRITGSDGCTPLTGRYARVGPAVGFRLRAGRRPDCVGQAAVARQAMRSALRRAASVEIVPAAEGDELVVRDAGGQETLRFGLDDAGSLEAGEWLLSTVVRDGVRTVADPSQPAVLSFRADADAARAAERRSSGEVVGSSGCNGIVGAYTRVADSIDVVGLQLTDAPCPEGLAAQEAAVRVVLEDPGLLVELPPDRMTLATADGGDGLEYVARLPLETTTWQLTRSPGLPPPRDPVTLRLEDGAVTGEGPCGSYTGAYATDGRFITLAGLGRPDDRPCRRVDRERAFFGALERAVLLERAEAGLRLLDVRGRDVARFRSAAAP